MSVIAAIALCCAVVSQPKTMQRMLLLANPDSIMRTQIPDDDL